MNYSHSCFSCIYLGENYNFKSETLSDLFYCPDSNLLVVRYGGHHSNYIEGYLEIDIDKEIIENYKFSIDFTEEMVKARELAKIYFQEQEIKANNNAE